MGEYLSSPITDKEIIEGETAKVVKHFLFLVPICCMWNARMEENYGRCPYL